MSRDRRVAPRHVPAQDLALVGWWDGDSFQHAPARLCDLSSTGVALSLAEQGLAARTIYICLAGANPTDWVRTDIAWSTTSEEGDHRLGLIFDGRCPTTLFKRAIWGKALEVEVTNVPPPPPRIAAPPPPGAPAAASPSASKETPATDPWTFVASTDADPDAIEPTFKPQAKATKARRRGSPLDWIVPFVVGISFALTVVALAFVTFADPQTIDPLVRCLTQQP